MKKVFIIVLLIIFAGLMSSCSIIVSKDMMGTEPALVSPAKVEGIWIGKDLKNEGEDDTFFFLKLDEKKRNVAHVLSINTRKKNISTSKLKFVIKKLKLNGKDYYIANIKFKDLTSAKNAEKKALTKYFAWFLFQVKKDRINAYMPVIKLFKDAVESGKLKGKVGSDYIRIDSSMEEIVKFIEKTGMEKLFVLENEFAFLRIRKFYINQKKSYK